MRGFFPILLLVLSGLIFYLFIDPTYNEVLEKRQEEAAYENALVNSNELIQVRDQLAAVRASFPQEDLDRLDVLLPQNVDTIRLIMEFDGITARHNLRMQNLNVAVSSAPATQAAPEGDIGPRGRMAEGEDSPAPSPVRSINLSFVVTGEYDVVRELIHDLERSLRIIDIQSVSFSGGTGESSYSIEVKTYWMN